MRFVPRKGLAIFLSRWPFRDHSQLELSFCVCFLKQATTLLLCDRRHLHINTSVNRRGKCPPQDKSNGSLQSRGTTAKVHTSDSEAQARRNTRSNWRQFYSSRWESLHFESDVAVNDGNVRHVDSDPHRSDWVHWMKLLEFRRRVYGSKGIETIWTGLRQRKIDLPTEGPFARIIWSALLVPATRREICRHALDRKQRTGATFGDFHPILLSKVLQADYTNAYQMHRWFRDHDYPIPSDSLAKLVPTALRSSAHLAHFKRIYIESVTHNIYDVVVPALRMQNRHDEAAQWHELCTRHLDYPLSILLVQELKTREVASSHEHYQKWLPRHAERSVSPKDTRESGQNRLCRSRENPHPIDVKQDIQPFSREAMNRVLGLTHGVSARPFDDRLCARLFATTAFSLDFIITLLSMTGIDQIGPTALRELAVRGQGPNAVIENITKLRSANITIRDCVYARVVEKLARDNRSALLQNVLMSDEHPDVYEDTAVLKSLLASYVTRHEWTSVCRVLIILTAFYKSPSTLSWNLLLQAYAQNSSLAQAAHVLEEMQVNNVPFNTHSMLALSHMRLRRRRKGHQPQSVYHDDFDELPFITNTRMLVLQSGFALQPWRWRELLRRYGMMNRLKELSKLCVWLVKWYSPTRTVATESRFATTFTAEMSPFRPTQYAVESIVSAGQVQRTSKNHPLNQIFCQRMQRAIVAWGFMTGFRKQDMRSLKDMAGYDEEDNSSLPLEPLRGLYLLRELRRQGLIVHVTLVRKEVALRLVILFGPGTSRRRYNRRDQAENPFSLEQLVVAIERTWGWKVFALAEDLRSRILRVVAGDEENPAPMSFDERLSIKTELLTHIYGRSFIIKATQRRVYSAAWAHWLQTKEQCMG